MNKNAKSKNGDTLADLEARATDCSARIKRYSDKIMEGDSALAPYRELLHEAEAEMSNLMCRTNVWLSERGQDSSE